MTELQLYMVCYPDGDEDIRFVWDEMAADLESDIHEAATWFYKLGKIEAFRDGDAWLHFAVESVAALVNEWEDLGSPKVMGQGKGPSRKLNEFMFKPTRIPIKELMDEIKAAQKCLIERGMIEIIGQDENGEDLYALTPKGRKLSR